MNTFNREDVENTKHFVVSTYTAKIVKYSIPGGILNINCTLQGSFLEMEDQRQKKEKEVA